MKARVAFPLIILAIWASSCIENYQGTRIEANIGVLTSESYSAADLILPTPGLRPGDPAIQFALGKARFDAGDAHGAIDAFDAALSLGCGEVLQESDLPEHVREGRSQLGPAVSGSGSIPSLRERRERTEAEAHRLWRDVDRRNLMIKVPATAAVASLGCVASRSQSWPGPNCCCTTFHLWELIASGSGSGVICAFTAHS